MKTISSDVIVIGGGIMGSSSAFFLRQRGVSVSLIERDLVGQHASGTNFGNVRRQGRPIYQLSLALRASEIWRDSKNLLDIDVEYRQDGHMRIHFDDNAGAAEEFESYALEAKNYGLDLELITGDAIRKRFPYLGHDVMGASYSASDGHANPRLVAPAFARAAQKIGARVDENTHVISVEKISDDFHVMTEQGVLYRAPIVLIATGAWGNELALQFKESVPLTSFGPTMSVTEPVPHCILPSIGVSTPYEKETVYFRQVERGNVVIGGSSRGIGFPNTKKTPVRPDNLLSQLEQIRRLAPGLGQLNIIRSWSGTEGYLPDWQSILGPSTSASGLYYAFGFSGAGFQIGPGVGHSLAELIATGTTDIDLSPYSPSRFNS
jgi:sarcosine oxidase subunit beta